MEHQKELFIQFMENNMPSEPFDPDKVLAAAREAVPDYQPSEQFTKGMDKLLQKSKRPGKEGYCQEVLLLKRGASGCRCVFSDRVLPGGCTSQ